MLFPIGIFEETWRAWPEPNSKCCNKFYLHISWAKKTLMSL